MEERSQCGLERSDSSRVFDYTNWKYIEATGRCSAVAKSRGRARWNSPTLARVPRTWRVCPGNKRPKRSILSTREVAILIMYDKLVITW